MATEGERGSELQSVGRAVSVLEHLSREGWSGVTDVANALDIHKSTAYRMLATLKARGLVEQDTQTERYRLGLGLVLLARAVTADLDVVRAARPVLQELSAETRETVTISVLAGEEVVVLDQTNAAPSILNVNWTGKHFPLHCTSDGKILLAHLPERQQELALARPLRRYTDQTVTDPARLREQLEAVRRDGYGFSVEELEVGLIGVAAPVFASGGRAVASISVSGPSFRLTVDSIPEVGEQTKRAAAQISRTLGFRNEVAEADSPRPDGPR
jgi:DNA-binding IclR family transcriptional regulator